MQEDAESVKLQWRSSEDRVFFIVKRRNQTDEIPISEAFVKGSHVIENLKDVDDDNEADVALSVAEVDAWHQCSDVTLDRSEHNYDTVIHALRVSELLGVEAEVERLVGHLATYLEPRALAQQRGVIASPPSEQERGDALRIMRAVQGQHAVRVLERVGRSAARAAPSRAPLIARRCLAHLLLCLPPSFHRYILCTQCPAAAADGTLTLPPLPRPIERPESRESGAADDCAKQPPSAGVLALTAAAALAGGPAPAPGGTDNSEPDEAVELGLAGAYGPLPLVTRLDVSLLGGGGRPWGAALAGCTALVSLSLGVVSVGALMDAGFADVAGGLPALTALAVRASRAQAMESASAAAFVRSVSNVTTLMRLELKHCFAVSKEPDVGAPYVEAIGGLSALGALSSLDLADNRFGERSAEAWADAVAAMDGLHTLRFAGLWHTGNRTSLRWRWSRRSARHLAALQCLELSEQRFMVDLVADVCCGGALCALSALRLRHGGITASMFADLEGVLTRLPRLRVLDVEGNELEDAGLEGVAAVLPALGALEELRVGGNRGTRWGVVAVVRAAVEVRARGGEGLRRLGVGPARVGAGGAEELGRLLAQLALETAAVPGLALGGEGTRGVLRALGAVASLREVVVCDGFCAGAEAGDAADEGAVFGGLEGVGVVGIQFLRKGACVGKDEVMVRVREALLAAGARVVEYDGRSGSLCL